MFSVSRFAFRVSGVPNTEYRIPNTEHWAPNTPASSLHTFNFPLSTFDSIFAFVEGVDKKIPLSGLDPDTLKMLLLARDLDPAYVGRLLYWIYRRKIKSFDEINDIPRNYLENVGKFFFTGLFGPSASNKSTDGSIKYLFKNSAGLVYETVYLPEGKRHTVCISVQSGCRMGCRFCTTGMYGWKGNLTAGEIINQVISIPHKITHVVFMGMGEAGDNIEEVLKACSILTGEWGLAVGRAKVTVSTVGIIPSMVRLLSETDCNITLSLHSPFPDERRMVIPAENRWPFREAIAILKEFRARRHRRFTVAYVMIRGINDTEKHLEELKKLFYGTQIRINLLSYHPVSGDADAGSDKETLMRFKHELVTSGIEATIRRSRGTDIDAACGMLAAREGNMEK